MDNKTSEINPFKISANEIIAQIESGNFTFRSKTFDYSSTNSGPEEKRNLDFNFIFNQIEKRGFLDKNKVINITFVNCNFDIDVFLGNHFSKLEVIFNKFHDVRFNYDVHYEGVPIPPLTTDNFSILKDYGIRNGAIFDQVTFRNFYFTDNEINTALFGNVQFQGKVLISRCNFKVPLILQDLVFNDTVIIDSSYFGDELLIENVIFNKGLQIARGYRDCEFKSRVSFVCAFNDFLIVTEVKFQDVFIFSPQHIGKSNIEFNSVIFNGPSSFRGLRLESNVIFANCDLTNSTFMYSKFDNATFSNCTFDFKKQLLDEKFISDEKFVISTSAIIGEGFTRILPSDVFTELRMFELNFDKHKDFELAGEFHKKRFELQRRTEKNKFKKLLISLYKWFSNYGEDYQKSLLWFLGILAGFTGVYLITGITYNQEFIYYPTRTYNFINDLGCAFLYSLNSSVPFKKDLDFIKSADGWTTFFSMIQTLLQTIIGTLFVIALRRKFKR